MAAGWKVGFDDCRLFVANDFNANGNRRWVGTSGEIVVTLSECCHIQYGRLVWQSFTVTEFCNSRPITGTDTSSFRVKCAKIPESKRTKFHSFHSKQLEFSCRLALFNYTSATRTIIQTESWRIVFDLT